MFVSLLDWWVNLSQKGCFFISFALMHGNPSDHDRLTLQEYIQTYSIRRKIQDRKRSKSKGQENTLMASEELRMKGLYLTIDRYLEETKIELEDILLNTEIMRDRIFFFISKVLDELMVRVKEEVGRMYKDVYLHYIVEHQTQPGQINPSTAEFLKSRVHEVQQQKRKSNVGAVIRDNFKKEEQQSFLANIILGSNINEPPQKNVAKSRYVPNEDYSPQSNQLQQKNKNQLTVHPQNQNKYDQRTMVKSNQQMKPSNVMAVENKPTNTKVAERPTSFMDMIIKIANGPQNAEDIANGKQQEGLLKSVKSQRLLEFEAVNRPRVFERKQSKADMRVQRSRPLTKK